MSVVLEVLYLVALGLKLLGSVEGDVGLVVGKKLLYVFLVDGTALALAVRTMFATEAYALVELDAEPAERLYNVVFGSRNETVGVGVLNTENEIAAMLTREEIVIQCCTHTTDVQGSRRTWCEAHPHFSI